MDDLPQKSQVPPAKPSKRGRSWKRWAVPPLVLILALGGAVYALTATGPGLRLAIGLAEDPIADAIGGEFSVDGVEGSLWSELRIGRLAVATPDGFSLVADAVRFDWTPLALLGGRLEVEAVGAEALSIALPEGGPEEAAGDDEPLKVSVPRLPIQVVVRKLGFPSVAVALPDGATYQASALGSVDGSDEGGIRTTLDVATIHNGKPVDTVALKALLQAGDDPEMDLAVTATIPPDGILFALLDLPPELRRPVSASVTGTGRLTVWTGSVDIAMQNLASLVGKAGFAFVDTGISASFNGTADLIDPAVLGLPGGLAGHYALSMPNVAVTDDIISVTDISVEKDNLASVFLNARMALDGSALSADGKATVGPSAAGLIDVPFAFERGQAVFQAEGSLPDVSAKAILSAEGVEGFDISARRLDGTISAEGSLNDGLDLDASVSASGVIWSDPALSQLLGETVFLTARTEIDPTFQVFKGVSVTVDPLGAELQAAIRLNGGTVTADQVQVTLADLGKLEPLLALPIGGAGSFVISGLALDEDGTVAGAFELGASEFRLIDDQVSGLVGKTPSVEGDMHLSPADGLVVTLHDIRARAGAATGIISLSPDFAELSGQVTLRALASALPKDAGLQVEGDIIDVTARFAGPVAQPDADVTISPFTGAAGGTPLQLSKLDAQIRWRNAAPFVTFQASGSALGLDASAEGGAELGPDGLSVPGVSVFGPGWSAWAEADLPGYATPAKGSARVVLSDAAPFAAIAGLAGLAGQATVDAEFSPGEGVGKQAATATIAASGIALQPETETLPITVEHISAVASIGDLLEFRDIDGTLKISNVVGDGFNLTEMRAVLQGNGSAVEGDVTVTGADPTPMSLSTHVSARLMENGVNEVKATDLKLAYSTLQNLVAGTVQASLGPSDVLSATADLSVLSGSVSAQYGRNDGRARLTLDASGIPLGPIAALQGQDGAKGTLSAKVALREEGAPAVGTFTVSATGLRTADLDKDVSLGFTVDGSIAGGRVQVEARTAGAGLENVDIRAGLPVSVSLVAPGVVVDQTGQLDGVVNALIRLREIWPYLPLPEHSVAGVMTADVRLGGTPAHPAIQGDATLADAEYEHLVHGTMIKNIQGAVRFAGEEFVLDSLTGQDGYGGGFAISGKGSLAGGAPSFDVVTKLNTLRVVNSDGIKADMDADIRSSQNAEGMRVEGQALIKRAEVNLGVALPPSIATLDVEDGSSGGESAKPPPPPSRIALDLTIDAPGQIFVRGRGLDSEWEGNVRVTGTATQPIVSGGMAARRGRIDVIGKGFTLDQSTIKFFGGETIDPMLGIRGVHEGDEITVIALLEGAASKPEIKLTSQPPLPEDEVLSRLLFGKTAASLGPLEAAQLAASASELTGGGSGLDVLGTIRDFVGVDVLEVDTSGSAAAVKAGTYLADGVFVGAKQGAAPGSSSVTVEVEVTPNISVTTESGQTSSNAGVNFKWDY